MYTWSTIIYYSEIICILLFLHKVALQFPEGLLLYACVIADIVEEYVF